MDKYKELQKFIIKYFFIFQEYSCLVSEKYWKKSQGICNNSQGIFVTTFAITTSKMLDNLSRNLRNLKRPPQLTRKQVRDHYAQKLLRISLWVKSFPTSVTSLRLQRFKTSAVTLWNNVFDVSSSSFFSLFSLIIEYIHNK